MPGKRFQLSGPSMEAIREQANALGSDPRVIAAEKVTVGGLAGMFGNTHYEAVVEFGAHPEPVQAPVVVYQNPMEAILPEVTPDRVRTIADLLAETNEAEAAIHRRPVPGLSTSSASFDDLIRSLQVQNTPEAAGQDGTPTSPVLSSLPGDLVVLAGVGLSALEAVTSMARTRGGVTAASGGQCPGFGLRAETPAAATAARARGVLAGQPVFLSYGLGSYAEAPGYIADLKALGADQVWLVVDVTRKHEDTEAWVAPLSDALDVTGVAVIGTRGTDSPRSARKLGLPVGWTDSETGEGHP